MSLLEYGPITKLFFFFSSRRRHTRWTGDWSSDVCSSDLPRVVHRPAYVLDHAFHAVAGEDTKVHERTRRRRQHVLFDPRLQHRGCGGRAEHRVPLGRSAELLREESSEQPAVRNDETRAERHLGTQVVEHGGRGPADGPRHLVVLEP